MITKLLHRPMHHDLDPAIHTVSFSGLDLGEVGVCKDVLPLNQLFFILDVVKALS